MKNTKYKHIKIDSRLHGRLAEYCKFVKRSIKDQTEIILNEFLKDKITKNK